MNSGHGEQQNLKKKAMKVFELVSSDKQQLEECKNDIKVKFAMDEHNALEVAKAIRDILLPEYMSEESIEASDLPNGFVGEMTEDVKPDFAATDTVEMNHDEDTLKDEESEEGFEENEEEEDDSNLLMEDSDDENNEEFSEVDDDEFATIHITVPKDKVQEVEQTLEALLSDSDAASKDHADDHQNNLETEENHNMSKLSREELRKTILAAMEEESVSLETKEGFEHAKSEQLHEEDKYNTKKGNLTDPEFDTLEFHENKIPDLKRSLQGIGLDESITYTKFDGTPEDIEEFSLDFEPFEIPSEGNTELYNDLEIPSEGEVLRKRTVNSSDASTTPDNEVAERLLAQALRTAGVSDEDMGKLTYAEGLELYKAIEAASEDHDEDHDSEEKEKETAKNDEKYVEALKKLMAGTYGEDSHEDKESERHSDVKVEQPGEATVTVSEADKKESMEKEALFKARVKTAYAATSKLAVAGVIQPDQATELAESWLADNMSVQAMTKQTKIMLSFHQASLQKTAGNNSKLEKTAGISFNPQIRQSAGFGGTDELKVALQGLFTTPGGSEMED